MDLPSLAFLLVVGIAAFAAFAEVVVLDVVVLDVVALDVEAIVVAEIYFLKGLGAES